MLNDSIHNISNNSSREMKGNSQAFQHRLKCLYPCVDDLTKLPQCWSTESKAQPVGLTYDNLGCYFRGNGRRDDDEKSAASIRTEQHIPKSCLLYYFEIKFVSKGREGRMGVGFAPSDVSLNKLPGWMQGSYGYHAEDGFTYSSEYKGLPCGSPSTSGDIIGCGYNLVEGKCFFTKNGLKIGKTFDRLPNNIPLHPTVGLKTPGEEIRANFGQEKFVYDIDQDLRSIRRNMTFNISKYPISDFCGWQSTLHDLVQSWLLQNSYPDTAEAFTRGAKMDSKINLSRVHKRYHIQQLVLNGRISEAIRSTNKLFPSLLNDNPNLLFALKCRQFIEFINGAENNCEITIMNEKQDITNIKSTIVDANDQRGMSIRPPRNDEHNGSTSKAVNTFTSVSHSDSVASLQDLMDIDQPCGIAQTDSIIQPLNVSEISRTDNTFRTDHHDTNFIEHHLDDRLKIDRAQCEITDDDLGDDKKNFDRLIHFGRELTNFSSQLDLLYGKNELNAKMLRDAISLIAYKEPFNSIARNLLDPKEREPLSQLLNSSIVRAEMGEMYRPPLEEIVNHLRNLIKLNDSYGSWLIDKLY